LCDVREAETCGSDIKFYLYISKGAFDDVTNEQRNSKTAIQVSVNTRTVIYGNNRR
jgi:hypothetical protein